MSEEVRFHRYDFYVFIYTFITCIRQVTCLLVIGGFSSITYKLQDVSSIPLQNPVIALFF